MAFLADDLNNGLTPAEYERSAEVVALSVEIDHEDAREAACRTFKDAALDLKVSLRGLPRWSKPESSISNSSTAVG